MAAPAKPTLPPYACRDVKDFDKLDTLGEGTYGKVFLARDRQTGEIVALKQVRMEHEKEGFPVTALREIQVLFQLPHVNVVRLSEIAVGAVPENVFLVFEYCQHDLATLMDRMKVPFSEAEVKTIMQQLLSAVAYMHSHWILHRDLKMSNLLYNSRGQVKVADFGLARTYGSATARLTTRVVTQWYRAPELLLGATSYSTGVDTWAIGCIFGELLQHKPLFPGKSEAHQLELIYNLLGSPSERIWPGFSELPAVKSGKVLASQPYNNVKSQFKALNAAGVDLLNALLAYDPEKRLSAKEALNHPYFLAGPAPKPMDMMPTFPEYRGTRPERNREISHVDREDPAKRAKLAAPR